MAVSEKDILKLPAHDFESVGVIGSDGQSLVLMPQGNQMVRVGDSIVLRITGFSPETAVGFKAEILPPAQPVAAGQSSPSLLDSGFVIENYIPGQGEGSLQKGHDVFFKVTVTQSGRLTLPSLMIKDTKNEAAIRTNPWSIDVASTFESKQELEKAELIPAKGPVGLEMPTSLMIAGLILMALATFGIGRLILSLYRKAKNQKSVPLPEVPIPEDTLALRKLEQLRSENLVKAGKHKQHYFRVSEIVKEYLSNRFEFDARESTSQEILLELEKQNRIPESKMAELENLFNRLDFVKFTDHVPAVLEADQVIQNSVAWVHATKRPSSLMPKSNEKALALILLGIVQFLGTFSSAHAGQVPLKAYLENQKGVEAFEKGKVEEAIKHFAAAQAHTPSEPSLQYNQGTVQLESGDSESGQTALNSATEAARKNGRYDLEARSQFNLGSAFAKNKDNAKAIAAFSKSLQAAKRARDEQLELEARRNIEILAKQNQQQKQQNQNQKQDQQQQNQQNQQNQNQQQNQAQNQKNKDSKQNQPSQYQDNSKNRQREFKSLKLSKDDAERVMAELSSREKELQGKLKQQKGGVQANDKDW